MNKLKMLVCFLQMFSLLTDVNLAKWTGDANILTGNLAAPEVHLKHKNYFTVYAILGVAQGRLCSLF